MTTAVEPRRRSAWQRLASWVLVVLVAIAVAGSVVGLWVHRTVLDTDEFMASVSPIIASESVQAVVADRIGDQLVETLDLESRLSERIAQAEERLRERLATALELPDLVERRLGSASLGLDSLAPMIAAGVEARIRDAVETFISSPDGTRLLTATIEIAHERSVLLLRDELDQLPNVVVDEGEVRLNLVPLMAEVLRSVVNAGLDFVGIEREIPPFDSAEDATQAVERLASVVNRDLPPDFGQVRLTSEASLEQAQGLVRTFDIALWLLILVGLVLAILAVWLAPTVPSGLVRIGVAALVGALVGWLGVQVISAQVVDAAATADGRAAVGDIVSSLVSGLGGIAMTLAILGIGFVVAGLVADRRTPAVPAVAAADPTPPAPHAPTPPAPAMEIEPAATFSETATATRRGATGSTSAKSTTTRTRTTKKSSAKSPKPTTRSSSESAPDAQPASETPTKKRRRPPATGA